ncbi:MAG: hypothetical protein ACTHNV_04125 [Ralstonia sp.]|uniref:hypothetical protein n=1 Tax=Ralstonia TaxID=48736 RepID=UPI002930976C|nr:hypothetical protein [Ralstonia wenshanensis]
MHSINTPIGLQRDAWMRQTSFPLRKSLQLLKSSFKSREMGIAAILGAAKDGSGGEDWSERACENRCLPTQNDVVRGNVDEGYKL